MKSLLKISLALLVLVLASCGRRETTSWSESSIVQPGKASIPMEWFMYLRYVAHQYHPIRDVSNTFCATPKAISIQGFLWTIRRSPITNTASSYTGSGFSGSYVYLDHYTETEAAMNSSIGNTKSTGKTRHWKTSTTRAMTVFAGRKELDASKLVSNTNGTIGKKPPTTTGDLPNTFIQPQSQRISGYPGLDRDFSTPTTSR